MWIENLIKWSRTRKRALEQLKNNNKCVNAEKRGQTDKYIHVLGRIFITINQIEPYPKKHLTITISQRNETLQNTIEA